MKDKRLLSLNEKKINKHKCDDLIGMEEHAGNKKTGKKCATHGKSDQKVSSLDLNFVVYFFIAGYDNSI